MAKAFLVRFGFENDFKSIKLQTRELGMALDTLKLYLGSEDENIHIPSETMVKSYIDTALSNFANEAGTTVELNTTQAVGSIAFNTETDKLQFRKTLSTFSNILTSSDAPRFEINSIVVDAENIDALDSNSISLVDFIRSSIRVYRNGLLCSSSISDINRYAFDDVSNVLKVYNCAAGDIVSYE